MTAKAKALQAVIAISVTALTVTFYNTAAHRAAPAREPAIKESVMEPIIIKARATKLMDPVIITTKKAKTTTPTATDNGQVPGYSNPDERNR